MDYLLDRIQQQLEQKRKKAESMEAVKVIGAAVLYAVYAFVCFFVALELADRGYHEDKWRWSILAMIVEASAVVLPFALVVWSAKS